MKVLSSNLTVLSVKEMPLTRISFRAKSGRFSVDSHCTYQNFFLFVYYSSTIGQSTGYQNAIFDIKFAAGGSLNN